MKTHLKTIYLTYTSTLGKGWPKAALNRTLLYAFILLFPAITVAQTQEDDSLPSPRGAFLRSLVVPGWGHYYANNDDWNRGKYYLAADAVLILSYFGLTAHTNNLENDFRTFALSKSGADLSGKSRNYLIAIGNYNNLSEYNDAMLQTRNWNQVYPDNADYRWNWESSDLREQYRNSRERVDKNRAQFPNLIALMVVNRLVSGIGAFIHARNRWDHTPEASFSYLNEFGEPGLTAHLRINF